MEDQVKELNLDPSQIPYDPRDGYLLLVPMLEEETYGSIIIPNAARRPLSQGVVLKAGYGEHVDCVSRYGEIVIFPLHEEQRFNYNRQLYYIIEDSKITLGGLMYKDWLKEAKEAKRN